MRVRLARQVSVLALSPSGDVEVIATAGDAHLGGDDFDSALVTCARPEQRRRLPRGRAPNAVASAARARSRGARTRGLPPSRIPSASGLLDEYAARGFSLKGDAAAVRAVREAAEAAKKRLSVIKAVDVHPSDAYAFAPPDAAVALSRLQLEELCGPLLQRLRFPLYEAALTARICAPARRG